MRCQPPFGCEYRFCADIAINFLNSAHLAYSFVSEDSILCATVEDESHNLSLHQRSKRTGWRDTDDLLNRLTAGNSPFVLDLHSFGLTFSLFSDYENWFSRCSLVCSDLVRACGSFDIFSN